MTPRLIRIERLVLHGVAPHDSAAVVAAFRAELARLVTTGAAGAMPRPEAMPRPGAVPHPGAVLPAPASAGAAGRTAAGVVARTIGGTVR